MAWQSGSASIPGVRPDGQTPAGITVDGLVASGGLEVTTPNESQFTVSDGIMVARAPDGSAAFAVELVTPIEGHATSVGGYLNVNSHTQQSSYTLAPGFFNTTPPATQPAAMLVTSTITDANAKAAIRELIALVNDYGLASITET